MGITSAKYNLKSLHKIISEEISSLYEESEASSIAYLIIEHFLEADRNDILTSKEISVGKKSAEEMNIALEKLKKGVPIQHITGCTFFYGLKVKVSPKALIPRQETEELVQLVINDNKLKNPHILDIGTGTGCIAIALKKNMPDAKVTALDNSQEALKVCRKNIEELNLDIEVLEHDIIHDAGMPGEYDIIVSNPPYVLESEKEQMHTNVLDHEPDSALFVPDNKALIYYECIIVMAKRHLQNNGKLYFEINESKGDPVRRLLTESGFKNVEIIKDLNGKDRFAKAEL